MSRPRASGCREPPTIQSISIEGSTLDRFKAPGCAVPALPIVAAICYKPFFAVTTIIVSVKGESVYPPRLRAQTKCFDLI